MSARNGTAPVWLFSFVDLTLLLLIAFTLTVGHSSGLAVAELDLPQIAAETMEPIQQAGLGRWQLRVLPTPASAVAARPYTLVPSDKTADPTTATGPTAPPIRLDAKALRAELATLRKDKAAKPLLVPDRVSTSENLLAAVSLLEFYWPVRAGSAVAVLPSVSAPPATDDPRATNATRSPTWRR